MIVPMRTSSRIPGCREPSVPTDGEWEKEKHREENWVSNRTLNITYFICSLVTGSLCGVWVLTYHQHLSYPSSYPEPVLQPGSTTWDQAIKLNLLWPRHASSHCLHLLTQSTVSPLKVISCAATKPRWEISIKGPKLLTTPQLQILWTRSIKSMISFSRIRVSLEAGAAPAMG